MKNRHSIHIAVRDAILALILCIGPVIYAADQPEPGHELIGTWGGELDTGAFKLPLTFGIEAHPEKNYTATLRVPIQTDQAIPVSAVKFTDGEVTLEVDLVAGRFVGKLSTDGDKIEGSWSQNGQSLPLSLTRGKTIPAPVRPQTPEPPFPYLSEEVTFAVGSQDHRLAGTLTLPEDSTTPVAAAVLISGSGPQDRDETILGHRPFAVIADHLTRRGIAVLRCDDRGFGKSTGKFADATTRDFADDASAAVDFLLSRSEIDPGRIGLIGHSEGGLIAPIVASAREDIAFIVLLAGPGVSGVETMLSQRKVMVEANGAPAELVTIFLQFWRSAYDLLLAEPVDSGALEQLAETFDQQVKAMNPDYQKIVGDKDDRWAGQMELLTSPWFRFFLALDPAVALGKLTCPVLALNGTLDMQVLADIHLPAIEKHLESAENPHFEIQRLEGLNHLFQNARTGLPGEYAEIEETIAPEVLTLIGDWITNSKTKR